MLPRNERQKSELFQKYPNWFLNGKTIIPSKALDGLNLIWNSDLLVSGGGTMNREAAALNIPAYSFFRGPLGAIDKYLHDNGRLILIENMEDIDRKIHLVKRRQATNEIDGSNNTLKSILKFIDNILAEKSTG